MLLFVSFIQCQEFLQAALCPFCYKRKSALESSTHIPPLYKHLRPDSRHGHQSVLLLFHQLRECADVPSTPRNCDQGASRFAPHPPIASFLKDAITTGHQLWSARLIAHSPGQRGHRSHRDSLELASLTRSCLEHKSAPSSSRNRS